MKWRVDCVSNNNGPVELIIIYFILPFAVVRRKQKHILNPTDNLMAKRKHLNVTYFGSRRQRSSTKRRTLVYIETTGFFSTPLSPCCCHGTPKALQTLKNFFHFWPFIWFFIHTLSCKFCNFTSIPTIKVSIILKTKVDI